MIFRYIVVGIVATLIFYVAANLFERLYSALLATFLANVISFIFGYIAQMRFTFGVNSGHKTMLSRYCILLALIFIYGQIITYLGEFYMISYPITSAFIAVSVPLFSYPLQKFWVFKKWHKTTNFLS